MTPTQTGRPVPPRPRTGTPAAARTRTGAAYAARTPGRTVPGRPPRRLEPKGAFRLTGRGAVVALFLLCFLSLLTGWSVLADAAFLCGCGVVTYYTKFGGLRTVVVCPPLVFLAGCACAEAVSASGKFAFAEGILVTLGTSAPWLFTGTALVIVIALGRGFRPAIPGLTRRAR
ncbi:MAG TPA: DUF6542 domain-containing protein [Streptosporangiaceae bacterium]|nr:DUF6542 domain-containing protein [Streptosporangiaceae bacterium]